MYMVIGWVPIPPGFHGRWQKVATHAAVVVRDQRVMFETWEWMRDCWTLEEWEKQQ